ncbi:DEAD-box ATP-dependent RNA helicase 7-like [Cannabis sativa]|uniref:DEAD-box ATP-dependent RNA helicase 7-like n=1 Tax=Cannabis sativa TaxID=3483 RepID=UPI0029CA52F4|nr:DEAD-box ATP-dependent RNA helicase 7-like [Cannabis sativa]
MAKTKNAQPSKKPTRGSASASPVSPPAPPLCSKERSFWSSKFMTLVAARGSDINDVQLIIQCEPPRNSGAAVMLYDPRRSNFSKIEREFGVKFEHISAPQPADVAKAAGVEAAEIINQISDSVIPAFKAAAEDLLNTSGLSAVEILSKALAKAAVS